jgi:hypothetical protein
MNPQIFVYEPRGMRVFNWYLYAYLILQVRVLRRRVVAVAHRRPSALRGDWARRPRCCPAGVILLFILLNIEIADFYATGPEITFRFGVSIAQDLTYTIGWLVFGLGMLAAASICTVRPGRMAAVALDRGHHVQGVSLRHGIARGLAQVGSFVGLAISLALVALALQRFVLQAPKEES